MLHNKADIIGKRFGSLVCIGVSKDVYIAPNGIRHTKYDFRCDCGEVKSIRKGTVEHGKQRSCGCLKREQRSQQMKKINMQAREKWDAMIGKKLNKLTILSFHDVNSSGHYEYNVQCECGHEKPMRIYRIASGIDKSCGCLSGSGKPAVRDVKYNKRLVRQRALRGLFAPAPAIRTTKATYTHKMD